MILFNAANVSNILNKTLHRFINFFTFGYGVKKIRSQENLDFFINGAGELEEVVVHNDLFVNGTAILYKVLVGRKLHVNGSLSASDSSMESLESNGCTSLKNCQIDHSIIANGSAAFSDCYVSDVTIKGKLLAIGSQFKSICVKKAWSGKHVIDLTDTIVQGDIVFDGVIGSVLLRGNAHINGNVIGGNVRRI